MAIQISEVNAALINHELARAPAAGSPSEAILRVYQKGINESNHPLEAVAVKGTPLLADIRAFGDAAIGNEFNPDGSRRYTGGTPEHTRSNRLTTVATEITDIINGHNLPALANNPDVQGWVEGMINQNADRAAQYRVLGAADQTAFRVALLSTKETKQLASDMLKEIIGPDKIVVDKSEEFGKKAENLQSQRKQLDGDRQEREKSIKELKDEIDEKRQETEKSIKDLKDQLDTQRQETEKSIKSWKEEAKEYTTFTSGAGVAEGKFVTQLRTLESEAVPLRAEVALLNKQVDEVSKRIDNFESTLGVAVGHIQIDQTKPEAVARRAALQQELTRLNAEQENRVKTLSGKNKELAEKETRIKAIQDRKTDLANNIALAEKAYTDKAAEITSEIARLNKEQQSGRTDLNSQISSLEKERQEIVKQIAEVDKNLAEALNNFHAERLKRSSSEATIIGQLESVIPTAVAGALNAEVNALVKADAEVEAKKATDAKSAMEAQIRTNLGNYLRLANNEVNWEHSQRTWNLFLGGGVDAILTDPNSVNLTAAQLVELKSNDELYNTLSTDIKNRMKRIRAVMPRGVGEWWGEAATFARGPQPLTSGEAVGIINQLGEPFLQELVTTDQSIRNALKAVGEQGMLTAGTNISENLKKRSLGELLFLLPILLAGGLFGKARP